nr:hypothetical protein [Anaerolineae bacterium]
MVDRPLRRPGPRLPAGRHRPTAGRAGRRLPAQRSLPRTAHSPGYDPDPPGNPAPPRHLRRDRPAIPSPVESRDPADGPPCPQYAGEYYTPRPIIRLMVKIVNPKLGEIILD